MAAEQLNGYVLHRRAYRETSFLVNIFTLENGKVSAVVKGVRGSKSDKKSLLQPFQPLLIGVSGRSELKNLQQVESTGAMIRLAGQALYCALYLNEVLNRVLADEIPHPEIFVLYQQSMHALVAQTNFEPVLRSFELGLLDALGYGIDLTHDADTGQPVADNGYYRIVPELGCVYQGDIRLSGCYSGQSLLNVASENWDKDSLLAAKHITRTTLGELLGSKPLMSRELFKQTHFKSRGREL
ncbi:DNA replication and repair protein RecO [Paraglaciecola sp. T6c]|uniref:DNA repair protein RecO n=1 Tax=Pseudoalteromonas atlantica (strain T6c / ATCC BAA-1087) TaxID=3042615 RepID=RECO_PSEA6|nr:DNA repair protein RecO [Paraglaciecola sp. T6c]Q15PH6.1 RecName: Full=DNA repair protein RecO; AltName: Full=Recombination protein O [Paraglaciecola sp. T6c]ABG42212.1 DNA replication and repair protein RecO [Paraglaciecola sp. T6c]